MAYCVNASSSSSFNCTCRLPNTCVWGGGVGGGVCVCLSCIVCVCVCVCVCVRARVCVCVCVEYSADIRSHVSVHSSATGTFPIVVLYMYAAIIIRTKRRYCTALLHPYTHSHAEILIHRHHHIKCNLIIFHLSEAFTPLCAYRHLQTHTDTYPHFTYQKHPHPCTHAE